MEILFFPLMLITFSKLKNQKWPQTTDNTNYTIGLSKMKKIFLTKQRKITPPNSRSTSRENLCSTHATKSSHSMHFFSFNNIIKLFYIIIIFSFDTTEIN